MFKNIGKTLKILANIYIALGILAAFCFFILAVAESPLYIVWFFVALLAFTLAAIPIYGFGELIDKQTDAVELLKKISQGEKNSLPSNDILPKI